LGEARALTRTSAVFPIFATDIWAVGDELGHWDGSAWTFTQYMAPYIYLGVWASGPQDVWVVGTDGNSSVFLH
jgi:hypothetical protein